jgi:regulator of protease activity HflC (stomatin/prohibitin superfamily)
LASGVLFYLSTSLYTVQHDEKALLLRFGKIVTKEQAIFPGIHLKFPFPIDRVVRFQTGRIQTLQLGNSFGNETPMIWSREHGDNKMFISGDNNLFLPYMIIHYRVNDIHRYYLHFRSGTIDKVITATANRLLNRTFSNTAFYDLLIYERRQWTESLKNGLQLEHDALKTGIEIVDFCLKDMHPPIDLAGAFEDVVAAEQLRKKYLNDAERQVIMALSREQIKSLKTIGEAESYVFEKKKVAQGEAANYLMRFEGYQTGGGIIKDVLLLEAAEKTLQDKKIIFIDPQSGIDEHTLYFENYVFGRKKK